MRRPRIEIGNAGNWQCCWELAMQGELAIRAIELMLAQ
jgi:hypothetical protein